MTSEQVRPDTEFQTGRILIRTLVPSSGCLGIPIQGAHGRRRSQVTGAGALTPGSTASGADLPSQYPWDVEYMAGGAERWHRAVPGPRNSPNAGVMEAVEDVNEAASTSECLCPPTSLVCLTRGQDRKPAHADPPSPRQPRCCWWHRRSADSFQPKGRGGDF